MQAQLEAQMFEPVRRLMEGQLGLDVIVEEFTAGYGVADLVGATVSKSACQVREEMGLPVPLDSRLVTEFLSVMRPGTRRSLNYILGKVSFSESTLRRTVLPQLLSLGLVETDRREYAELRAPIPQPTDRIVAVELKQTRWKEAILQARRYAFFAEEAYIAVWARVVPLVDRALLYRHRLGLIAVDEDADRARVVVAAIHCRPRVLRMHSFCAEHLYGAYLC